MGTLLVKMIKTNPKVVNSLMYQTYKGKVCTPFPAMTMKLPIMFYGEIAGYIEPE